MAVMTKPIIARGPSRRKIAPLFEAVVEVDLVFVVEAAGVGVNTAPGLAIQELAAALAAETLLGAFELTVPLPAKLQACTSLLLAS